MRVEVLRNLRASKLWKRGTVFNDAVSPIPNDILTEVHHNANTVRVLPDVMSRVREAATEIPIVAAEAENENEAIDEIVEETPPEIFPELERLIEMKGSLAEVARLFNVTYVTVKRWRHKVPRADMVSRIKKAYARLIHDQGRNDDPAPAGTEGVDVQPG